MALGTVRAYLSAHEGGNTMRRRERWRGLAWVAWMEGDSEAGGVQRHTVTPPSLGASMVALVHDYHRFVDIEQDGSAYKVRVLPAREGDDGWHLQVGFLYSGLSLPSILATAVVELDLLGNGQALAKFGAKERARWVM